MNSKIKDKDKYIYTLEEVIDEHVGLRGTPARDEFENEIAMELLSDKLKDLRKSQNLTQEELGKVLGVQKSQISKLEKNLSNAKMSTVLKVFSALNTNISFVLNQRKS